ncbi:MAG TPA: ADP-forming succinate--CoA ligase subunit beta [Geobacterales bacterium]|nr:ADP-forming succinate--CoA ligase subunit beta [Geobacterales bacterium]
MRLFEYEAKEIFKKFQINVPPFGVAKNVDEALAIAKSIGYPIVIKAQVLVGGRGKAGGVQFANNDSELVEKTRKILGMEIKGIKVESVLVGRSAEIKKELYLSIIVDRNNKAPVVLASKEGGVEIEEIAKMDPSKIFRMRIDPLTGLREFHLRRIEKFFGRADIAELLNKMYKIFKTYDCELLEINPLAIDDKDELIAVDAKMTIDDSSLFRQKDFRSRADKELNEFEIIALEKGFSYVESDGDIGIISNGAGLTMSTMDVVQLFGGRPANFLDIGGGASADVVYNALMIQLKHPRTKGIFINILGGITRCDEVAQGIVKALKEFKTNKKISIRMMGTNEEEGRAILAKEGIKLHESMEEAAKEIVESVK